MAKYLMWILWPSFIGAGMGVGIVFSLIDPTELVVLGQPMHLPRLAAYTLGFFILWSICAVSSAVSSFLQATEHRVQAASSIDKGGADAR